MKPKTQREGPDSRQRVLEAACQLFSEKGFQCTGVREICRCARANIAAVSYHFHGKEQLYRAVVQEACRRLALARSELELCAVRATPEQSLRAIIQSLFQKLSGENGWIAKLAARECLEADGAAPGPVTSELCDDLLLVQAVLQEPLGSEADPDAIRLHALSLLGQCVFLGVVWKKLSSVIPPFRHTTADQGTLVRHLVNVALEALAHRSASLSRGGSALVTRHRGCQRLQPCG